MSSSNWTKRCHGEIEIRRLAEQIKEKGPSALIPKVLFEVRSVAVFCRALVLELKAEEFHLCEVSSVNVDISAGYSQGALSVATCQIVISVSIKSVVSQSYKMPTWKTHG